MLSPSPTVIAEQHGHVLKLVFNRPERLNALNIEMQAALETLFLKAGSDPNVRAIVVTGEGQRLVMAGGGTSWLDLALYLNARHTSIDAAMHIARLNLIDWNHVVQQPFAR